MCLEEDNNSLISVKYVALLSNQAGTEEIAEESRIMYQRLLGNYDAYLPKRIHIVANGLFETFPFAALRKDSSGAARYFGEEQQLSYHYSLRNLAGGPSKGRVVEITAQYSWISAQFCGDWSVYQSDPE